MKGDRGTMTNTKLLRNAIDDSGYKMKYIAEKIGLTYQGFLNKLKGSSQFGNEEILELCDLLNINESQMTEIFFTKKVDERC